MKLQYTQEDWEIDWEWNTAINAKKKHIAMVNQYNAIDPEERVWGEEHKSNAILIRYAPRMYELLEDIEILGRNANTQNKLAHIMGDKARWLLAEMDKSHE